MVTATKVEWIARHGRCVSCGATGFEMRTDALRCQTCGRVSPCGSAVDFLDEATRRRFGIVETDNVSEHPFDGNAGTIIQRCAEVGGMVLDCGSGAKDLTFEHVIQMEVVAYPSVDVLAVNQQIPFADDTFDAVFSLDVLEHVRDPFECAAEITRVLKPGGCLYLDLPFLQAEHGYPDHYFNATRSGVRRLFSDLEVLSHYVPRSGCAMFTVHQVLDLYTRGLPAAEQERLRSLTVGDLLARPPADWLGDGLVTGLAAEQEWLIASATQAVMRKPPVEGTAPSRAGLTAEDIPGAPEYVPPAPASDDARKRRRWLPRRPSRT